MSDRRMTAWIAYFTDVNPGTPEDARRWWSGHSDLVFDGQTWRGTQSDQGVLMSVAGIASGFGPAARRIEVRLALTNEAIRRLLSVDLGAIGVEVGIIYSDNSGETWARSPRSGRYRLSNHVIADGVLRAELESWLGDLDRRKPRTWSNEEQQVRHPGDLGLIYKRQIAEGLRDVAWPP